MNKNFLIVGILIAVVLVVVGGFFLWRSRQPAEPVSVPKQEGILLETPFEERPYVTLTPRTDGREFTLDIAQIKNARTIEYELVYLSNGLSRGVIGSIDLEGETEVSRKLLLGTCSRNVCKYDEGVEEGTLTLRFRGSEGTRKFVSEFHLQRGDKELTSVDGDFSLEGKFPAGTFYLTMSTVGLPEEMEGQVLAGPFGVFSVGSQSVSNGELTVTLKEEAPLAELYAWSGKTWKKLKSDLNQETITAEVDSLGPFVVIASE